MDLTLNTYQQARLSRDPRFDGQFFIAVKTTGIFCRTICPANLPKEENVEYFPLAQQALQAGYRPCLRCRPDSAPGSYAWLGNDTTVIRAIKLIQQYPHMTIATLTEKLGIGERYLRMLFEKKIGLSPKQFQLFERLLFAKKLLHESSLSVEAIAQATGFNSARALQIQFKKWLSLPPSALRKQSAFQPVHNDQRLTFTLSYQPPYNWPLLRDFLAVRAIEPIEKVEQNSYQKYFTWATSSGWFCATHHAQDHRFLLELQLNDWSYLMPVLHNIRRLLDLNAQTGVIESCLLESGLPPGTLVEGLRLPGVWSPFEAACRAILGQQISVSAAITQANRLCQGLTGDTHIGTTGATCFPLPEQIANSDLSFLKMPQARKNTLIALSQYVCDHGENNVDAWLDIKGIGPWTLQYVKLRGLSEPDCWLAGDLIIKQQLNQFNVQPEACQPWRSYLTLQLWQMATCAKHTSNIED